MTAAQSQWEMPATQPTNARIQRNMALYVRFAASMRPTIGGTMVEPQVDYVVYKEVKTFAGNGETLTRNPQVIVFESGDSGRFPIGTTCVSSGVLERALASSLPVSASRGVGLRVRSAVREHHVRHCPSANGNAVHCGLIAILGGVSLQEQPQPSRWRSSIVSSQVVPIIARRRELSKVSLSSAKPVSYSRK